MSTRNFIGVPISVESLVNEKRSVESDNAPEEKLGFNCAVNERKLSVGRGGKEVDGKGGLVHTHGSIVCPEIN